MDAHRQTAGGDSYALGIDRRRIANGGWEWFLTVGGRRVGVGENAMGIITGPEVEADRMLPRLLGFYTRPDFGTRFTI